MGDEIAWKEEVKNRNGNYHGPLGPLNGILGMYRAVEG